MKDQILKENNVIITVDLDDHQKVKDDLDIEFWINPTSIEAYNFISGFRTKLESFDEFISFKPMYKF